MKRLAKEVLGYLAGGLLVFGAIPGGMVALAATLDALPPIGLAAFPELRLGLVVFCLAPGGVFGFWSVLEQRMVGLGGPVQVGRLELSPRTKRLVTSGPYRYTRNPMLFGACLLYLGLALALDSWAALAYLALFMSVMLGWVVRLEEKRLLEDFGDEYREYRRRTSAFVPWFKRR
jgi:hypothetical protein